MDEVRPMVPVTYYEGKVISGSFYEHVLLKFDVRDMYLIDKVIQRKGDRRCNRWASTLITARG